MSRRKTLTKEKQETVSTPFDGLWHGFRRADRPEIRRGSNFLAKTREWLLATRTVSQPSSFSLPTWKTLTRALPNSHDDLAFVQTGAYIRTLVLPIAKSPSRTQRSPPPLEDPKSSVLLQSGEPTY